MMRDTSIEAFRKIKADGLLSKRRLEVYAILFDSGPMTAHEIVSKARSFAPNANQTSFNARLSELKRMGVVKEVGLKRDPISNQECILWDVTSSLPDKLEVKKGQSSFILGYRKALLDIECEMNRRALLRMSDPRQIGYITLKPMREIIEMLRDGHAN